VTIFLVKLTLVLGLALACLPLLRRKSAAIRHLLCACGLIGVLLLPLALIAPAPVSVLRIPATVIVATAKTTQAGTHWRFAKPLEILWAAGAVLFALRIATGYWRLAWLRKRALPIDVIDTVPVLAADVSTPLVFGLFHPAILLPANWPATERNVALRHELAHLERHDLWTSLAAHLACAVYWFHPFTWLLARRLQEEQEAACDDAVLSTGFEPAVYAEALLTASRSFTSTQLIGCHMLTQRTLKSRIARLLVDGLPRMSSPSTVRRTILVFAATLATIGLVNATPQSNDDTVHKMGDGVTAPRVLAKVEPEYDPAAKDAKIAGTVLLSVVVGTDGVAHDINVVQSLTPGLDSKAIEAVQQWKFQPGTLNGEPVKVQARIEINFKLM
jgi:TonB family protein